MLEVQLCQIAWVHVHVTLKSLRWDVLTASAGQPTGTDWVTLFLPAGICVVPWPSAALPAPLQCQLQEQPHHHREALWALQSLFRFHLQLARGNWIRCLCRGLTACPEQGNFPG